MATYKNLQELAKALYKDMGQVMKNEVANTVKTIEQQAIQEQVYNVYNPTYYNRRRVNEGLQDERNMIESVVVNAENVELTIVNTTKSYLDDHYIAEDIEYGYGDKNKLYNQPRPFTQTTERILENTNAHEKALIKGLKSKGYDVR